MHESSDLGLILDCNIWNGLYFSLHCLGWVLPLSQKLIFKQESRSEPSYPFKKNIQYPF